MDNENCFEQSDDEYSDSGDESEDDDVISSQRGGLGEDMNDSDEEREKDDGLSEYS